MQRAECRNECRSVWLPTFPGYVRPTACGRPEWPLARFPGGSLVCGIAGYSLSVDSRVHRTLAAQALLAGIAERGADATGYAWADGSGPIDVHKRRSGASGLLDQLHIPDAATSAL